MEEQQCLFCFLTSYYQKKIMKLAQLQEEKFEDILERYRRIFMAKLAVVLDVPICKKHSKIFQGNIILSNIRNNKKLIWILETFFDNLIEIYKLWISGKAFLGIAKLKKVLKTNHLFKEETFNIEESLFFRGRKNNNKILNRYEMFHIPYDKRYLVGNQRFSLSGFPLLYLSSSINGVKLELDIADTSFYDYSFSSFHFNKKSKIYSLDNPFRIYFEKVKKNEEKGVIIVNYPVAMNILKEKLLKLILSSICLFEKRVSHKRQEKSGMNIFYQEYIIPQALTQVLKIEEYDGIFYPSTRIEIEKDSELLDINGFNIAYFPEYKADRHYDDTLFTNLDISVPLNFSESEKFIFANEDDFQALDEIFKKIGSKINIDNNNIGDKFLNLHRIYLKHNNYKKDDQNENKECFKKFEKTIIYNFLLKNLLDLENERRKL